MNYFFRQYGEVANITRIQNSWALGSCSAAAFFMPAVVSMSKDLFAAVARNGLNLCWLENSLSDLEKSRLFESKLS